VGKAAFLLELGGVILGLAVLARIATRVGVSAIPLFLLAGLAFGEGGVLPLVTASRFIELGAEIGVVLLLFMLGLEYSAVELTSGLRRQLPSGLADLLLNFTPGLVAGLLLGWGLVAAIFLGGVTYISSSGIVARLVDDLGWLGNRETPVVVSILVIEDLVMAVYLSLLVVLVSDVGLLQGVLSLAAALGGLTLLLLVAVRWGERLSSLVFTRSDQTLILTVLGITLVVAGLVEQIGISAAVGAFLVGLVLSGEAAERASQLLGPLRDLFAAVFFVFFGLSIDPGTIPGVLPTAASLAILTTASKLATGWWSARREGVGQRGRWRAGALLVARGEFSIAIAGIASVGGVQADLPPLAGAYVMLLAVAGPLLAKAIDPAILAVVRRRERGRDVARRGRRARDAGPDLGD
jgi:CPA2 family monovalent cation:H+ antiporter-2